MFSFCIYNDSNAEGFEKERFGRDLAILSTFFESRGNST